MKTIDYINSLIKERDKFKEMCENHIETIRLIKRELVKLNNNITKKDKKIAKLENESLNLKTQREFDKVKNDLKNLKIEYKNLENKYNAAMNENAELKSIFDEIENICDGSDGE